MASASSPSNNVASRNGSVINLNDMKGDIVEWSKYANHVYIGRESDLHPASEFSKPYRPEKTKDGLKNCLKKYEQNLNIWICPDHEILIAEKNVYGFFVFCFFKKKMFL